MITWHFDLEKLVYCHLAQDHRHKEMAMVPDSEWDDERAISDSASTRLIPRHMHALACYTAAIGLRERSHVTIIGPSLDRRMLNILTKLCNSDTIRS